jgi:hypothetical protein
MAEPLLLILAPSGHLRFRFGDVSSKTAEGLALPLAGRRHLRAGERYGWRAPVRGRGVLVQDSGRLGTATTLLAAEIKDSDGGWPSFCF